MNGVEFTTELTGAAVLPIPREIEAQLPKSGKAHIIVLTDDATDKAEWRAGAYEQFLRDDSAECGFSDRIRHSQFVFPRGITVVAAGTQENLEGRISWKGSHRRLEFKTSIGFVHPDGFMLGWFMSQMMEQGFRPFSADRHAPRSPLSGVEHR